MGLVAVYACIKVLAESMGQLPCVPYRERGDNKEIAKDHRIYKLLRQNPNPEMTAYTFFEVMQSAVAGWGNAYALINFERNGKPAALWPLQPDTVFMKRVDGNLIYEFTHNGKKRLARPADILHIKALGGDGLTGWSPIKTQREILGAGLSQQQHTGRFYANGARPSGVLSFPGKIMDTTKLRDEWQAANTGDNAGKVAILENGLKYEQISIDPVDAEFVETAKLNAVQVASIFRVPPHMINILDRATWGNVESLGLEFVVHTLGPWFVRWQQEIETKLLTVRERATLSVRFDARALMRGDHKARSLYYKSGVVDGWMTRNEVRALEDMNPIEGLDEPLQPLNMIGANEEPPDPADDPFSEPPDDEEKDAERTAFDAAVGRLAHREQHKVAKILARSHHISPAQFHAEIRRMYERDQNEIRRIFGCDDATASDFVDRRVFALDGMVQVKQVQDWLGDLAARRVEIEDNFR